mmetsp:Transcript_9045/g.27028  ORF Transcript_9045/g.27028 Transcript_9045/m.27028 type:complete len:218 (-) Transcript_9045:3369-4022(-)
MAASGRLAWSRALHSASSFQHPSKEGSITHPVISGSPGFRPMPPVNHCSSEESTYSPEYPTVTEVITSSGSHSFVLLSICSDSTGGGACTLESAFARDGCLFLSRHRRSLHFCFRTFFPPNFGLSRQQAHFPQSSSLIHPEHKPQPFLLRGLTPAPRALLWGLPILVLALPFCTAGFSAQGTHNGAAGFSIPWDEVSDSASAFSTTDTGTALPSSLA